MKKEILIEKLQQLPDDIDICIFDWKKNAFYDEEESSIGIYPDIEIVDMTTQTGGDTPWIGLSFDNEVYLIK